MRDGQWQVQRRTWRAGGARAHLILANGAGAMQLPHAAPLPLTAMRGQVSHLPGGMLPALPVVLCREAYLTPPSPAAWSAPAPPTTSMPIPRCRPPATRKTCSACAACCPIRRRRRVRRWQGRVGFRCIAPDRLPLVGRLPDFAAAGNTERLRDVPRHPGLYALLGYASRGLIWAGWAAELLAAQLEGEPLPLEASLVDALDPARFVLRARRTSRGPQATGL
jgi:tRNA 5-methylaminomethyl-2-thiouridine biosynthesis bifunctional protein